MINKEMQQTYHDPKSPIAGLNVPLNEFLGIDKRGNRKLSPIARKIEKDNHDRYGERIVSPRWVNGP